MTGVCIHSKTTLILSEDKKETKNKTNIDKLTNQLYSLIRRENPIIVVVSVQPQATAELLRLYRRDSDQIL